MGSCLSVSAEKQEESRATRSNSGPVARQSSGDGSKRGGAASRTKQSSDAKGSNISKNSAESRGGPGRGSTSGRSSSSQDIGDGPAPARRFKYRELQIATNNFDEAFVLGEGSFGKVYRGSVEEGSSRIPVAIKKLNPDSFQGYEEWLAEVLLLDKLRHPNLVRLVGYCAEKGEALLAYELCPKGSLDQLLFGGDDQVLSWPERVKVALDSARGLAYLHENNVIHRDFKPSNILLADDLCGRLTDFGMARAGPDGGETHISTRVMGTLGYLDPMYMETGRLTRKSDTYAFGVMLLELLTGRRSVGETGGESLTLWVRPLLSQRKPDLNLLVDPRLKNNYSKAGAVKMAILAKHCINDDPGFRPEMSTLAENLELVDTVDP